MNILIPSNRLKITAGAGSVKQYTETHESGQKLTIHFCAECGCGIYKTHEAFGDSVIILAGTLDDPDALETCKPEAELYATHRVSWVKPVEGAEQSAGF